MRTIDQANYALNRRTENRRIYAEQQVAWFYAELLVAQRCYHVTHGVRGAISLARARRNLAEAHASLDAISLDVRPVDVCQTSGTVVRAPYPGTVTCGFCGKSFDTDSAVMPVHHNL